MLGASMFKIFKRRETPASARSEAQKGVGSHFPATTAIEPEVSQPEVSEGSSEADWLLWERAVAETDSSVHARPSAIPVNAMVYTHGSPPNEASRDPLRARCQPQADVPPG